MKVRHTLICFFFLSLQDGNNGLVKAQIYTRTEGGDVTVKCSSFTSSGSSKILCKKPCKQEDNIIETTDVRAQKGRFSIEWSRGDISVTITQLTKSDSGLYGCGLKSSYQPFEIIVVDAWLNGDSSEETTVSSTPGGNISVGCVFPFSRTRKSFFCKGECKEEDVLVSTTGLTAQRDRYSISSVGSSSVIVLYVGITELTRSDSGRYRCGLERTWFPDSYHGFEIVVTDAPPTSTPNQSMTSSAPSASTATTTQSSGPPIRDVLLSVSLTLLVMVIVSLSVLLFCRRRTSKPKEAPVEIQCADKTEASRVYEDIREDGQSRSRAVEINDDYSLIAAVNLQNTAEDNSSRLIYSDVTFSSRNAGSSSSGIRGDDNVVYSVPRVETLRDEDDLYSTVNGELRG